MSQESVKISIHQKRIAVAYMLKTKNLRPAGTEKLFGRLERYDIGATNLNKAYQEAQKSISELEEKLISAQGSIQATVDIITDSIDEKDLAVAFADYLSSKASKTFAKKENIPGDAVDNPRTEPADGTKAETVDKAGVIETDGGAPDSVVDIAGSTALKK